MAKPAHPPHPIHGGGPIDPSQRIQATVTGQTQTSISLSWTLPPPGTDPATPFRIVYRTASTQDYPFSIENILPSARSATVPGLNPATTYYFVVQETGSGYVQSLEVQGATQPAGAVPGTARWVRNIVAGFNVLPSGLLVDSSNGIALGGAFDSNADFGGGPQASMGALSGFIAKYATTDIANSFLWSKLVTSNPGSHRVNGVAVNPNDGSIVAIGQFTKTVDFGNGYVLSADDPNSFGLSNMFVAKYLSSGVTDWAIRFGDGGNHNSGAIGYCVTVDPGNGDVFGIGTFFGPANFGGIMLTASGRNMAFVKLSGSSGTTISAVKYGSATTDSPKGISFEGGSLFVCGQSNGLSDYGGGIVGGAGGFMAQYNSSNLSYGGWSKVIANSSVNAVTVDGGALFATGEFQGSIDLGDGVVRTTPWNGNGGFFIVRYDAAKNVVWGKVYGQNLDQGLAIAVKSGLLVMSGKCAGLTDFEGTGIPTGGNGWLIASFTTTGTYRWSKRSGTNSWGYALGFDFGGHVFSAGSFQGDIDFGNGVTASCPLGLKNGFITSFTA